MSKADDFFENVSIGVTGRERATRDLLIWLKYDAQHPRGIYQYLGEFNDGEPRTDFEEWLEDLIVEHDLWVESPDEPARVCLEPTMHDRLTVLVTLLVMEDDG